MIAENIRTWEEKVRAEGIQQGMQQGYEQANVIRSGRQNGCCYT